MSEILILNDQGGGVMSVSRDITATLRAQDHGHPPLVVYSIDQGGGKSACVILDDVSPTLTTTHYGAPAVCYEGTKTNDKTN